MVSSKERIKLARMFDIQQEMLHRQKAALTRMNLMLLESTAALFEIAGGTTQSATRAQEALDRMEVIRSSGNEIDGEESEEVADDSGPEQGDGA